jgi:phospholipid transport system substrate-binding protein
MKWVEQAWCCAAGIAALFSVGTVQAAGPPTEAVRGTITEVLRILADETLKRPEQLPQRRRLLEETVGARFNYEEMSKRTLAGQWKQLSEAERKEFVALFRSFLTDSYADKIEGYAGEDIRYLGERLDGPYAEVRTRVVSNKVDFPIEYRLFNRSGEWLVYDVVIDGVSLVRNYRGQFEKIIRDSSYQGLVEKLRKKVKEFTSSAQPGGIVTAGLVEWTAP